MKFLKIFILSIFAFGLLVPNGIQRAFVFAYSTLDHISDIHEHIHEHEHEDEDFSIFNFAFQHSGKTNHHHTNSSSHDDMPMNHLQPVHEIAVFYLPQLKYDFPKPSFIEMAQKDNYFYQQRNTNSFLDIVWQPPKLG